MSSTIPTQLSAASRYGSCQGEVELLKTGDTQFASPMYSLVLMIALLSLACSD